MKNNNPLQKNIDAWKGVRLSDSARARIGKNLSEYVQFHGVREVGEGGVRMGGESRSIGEAVQHSHNASFVTRLINLKHTPMTALVIAALLVSGGTSFAAGSALPGDTLYPVKVGVNEEVRSMFAFGAEAEARLQAALVAERLEEAKMLAAEGELNADASANLQSRIEAHAERARAEAVKLDAQGDANTATEVRTSLVNTLEAYATIIGGMNATGNTDAQNSLLIEVETEHNATVEAEADANTHLEVNVDGVLDGVINIDAHTETTSGNDANTETETDDKDTNLNLDLDADVNTDTSVDTGILDINATTDTSVRTNTGLGL
jgi:hypothetical protein